MKKISIALWLIISFYLTFPSFLYSQWEFAEIFPDQYNPDINQTGGIHGIAVDPEGKIWSINYYAYDRDLIYVAANINQYVPIRAIYVFNPDGTQTPFSPIKFVTINGVTDTIGGYTTSSNTWEPRTGRGMKVAPDGNIVVAMYDAYYKINYLTGEGINKVTPVSGLIATAPAFSNNGHMFTGPVAPGNPVKEFDENFNFIQDVISSTVGFSRSFEVSSDGLTLYWGGYTNNCVYKYTRQDISLPFNDFTIILKGFAAESFCWYPNSEILWLSAGSGMDLPNQYPDTLTYYSYCTWYGYNISNNKIIDSLKWHNLIDPTWQRPRAIAFSNDGKSAYVGMFGETYYEGIQKFSAPPPIRIVQPNGGEFFSIGYIDTIKWASNLDNLKLEYSTDLGNNWEIIENSIPASTGQYAWLVPNTPSENSLVKISDVANNSIYDVSDNVFTISEPPVITVSPDSFYYTLNEGDSTQSELQISNTGLGNLFYEILIENVSKAATASYQSTTLSPSIDWKKSFLETRERLDKNFMPKLNKVNFDSENLPLILSDPVGDGGPVDIIQIRGRSTADSIQMEFVFQTDLNLYDFGGYLGLDTDQNPFTGQPLPNGLQTQEMGCEFYIILYGIAYGYIDIYDQYWNYIGYSPAEYDLRSFRFSIPLSSLNNDDGIMNLAAVVGNSSGPTDWIPDEGYGILGRNLWLTIEPLTGIVSPGGNGTISVKINTDKIDGGEYYANVLVSSNDPVNQQIIIPVHLTVIGQPDLIAPVSADFEQVYVGYPKSVEIRLKNNGSVTLEVSDIQSTNSVFTVNGSTKFDIEPLQTYDLSIQFAPVSAVTETGTLSIISNDPSSPFDIGLSGEGVYPPVTTVSPDSFYYNLNVGDSITTQLTIDNSTGLGELVFQISDRLIEGNESFKISSINYIKHPRPKEWNKLFGIDPNTIAIQTSRQDLNFVNQINPVIINPLSLPLIVQDNIGDGGKADIKEIRGRVFNNNLEIEYVFADEVNISDSLVAVLYLDTDRNPSTGLNNQFYYHDLGVDYFIDFSPYYYGNQIYIYEYSTGYSFTVPFNINGTTISYTVPLSFIGNDDGEMNLLALSGDINNALDWAPDEGHATIFGDVFWLSENPTSGIIPAGSSLAIEISAITSELIGGNYIASIDVQNNDPSNPLVNIPFKLHLIGVPKIVASPDSLNFGETYIGYYNSLNLIIESTGTDSLVGTISSSDPHFSFSDSVFALPVGGLKPIEVQFHPTSVGIISKELTIHSNASSIPINVILVGVGVVAPNIITSDSLMQFQLGAGGTIESQLCIYNTGGSNLTVEISDVVTNVSVERLFGAGYNMIYEIDPDNGQIINSFSTPIYTSDYSTGLAFSGEYLFFANSENSPNIFVLNPKNGNIITYYSSQSGYCNGLAYIDPYLYVLDVNDNVIRVLNPTNGNLVNVIYSSVYLYGGLDGGENRLFASDPYTVYELNPKNGNVVNSFYTYNGAYGIGFTGERLFVSTIWSGIEEYDPNNGNYIRAISTTGYSGLAGGGKRDADWLSENPTQVIIAGGDSIIIKININALNELGHYSANLILKSNDPDAPVTIVHVVLDVVTGVNEDNLIPTVYSLYNNYPNPFNPSTTISYDIPKLSNVTLKIFNITGEEVATLVNQEQIAGRYQVRWEASKLASGIYFYRLQTNTFIDTKKMILLK